jgi:DNA-binding response OmpR family regulator
MPSNEYTLLLVDDEEDLLESLQWNFEYNNFNILTACSGNKAFEVYKSNQVDGIITDVRMPDGDGMQLVKNIREHFGQIPTITFITGFTDITTKEAYGMGVSGVFTKPFSFDVLLKHVQCLLKPPEERWSQSTFKQDIKHQFKESFSSVEEALLSNKFRLGRGGISLQTSPASLQIDDTIEFAIYFSSGEIKSIIGQGIIRWQEKDKPSDTCKYGIEFDFLEPESRADVIPWIENNNISTFLTPI